MNSGATDNQESSLGGVECWLKEGVLALECALRATVLRREWCLGSQEEAIRAQVEMWPGKEEAWAAGSGLQALRRLFYGVLQNAVAWCRPVCEF